MMTALQSFSIPHISTEDAMELSNEADRRIGQEDDIDVDLLLNADQPQGEADEDMTEDLDGRIDLMDGEGAEGFEGADALMEDTADEDSQRHSTSVQDEIIQDASPSETRADEDIIVDDLLDEAEEPSLDQGKNTGITASGAGKPFDGFPEDFAAEAETITRSNAEYQADRQESVIGEMHNTYPLGQTNEEKSALFLQGPDKSTSPAVDPTSNAVEDIANVGLDDIKAPDTTKPSDSQSLVKDAGPTLHGAALEPQKHLHPMLVLYQDTSMSLFPPMHEDEETSQTFLLDDERLAAENIQNLLNACRTVLGESISEDDELELAVDELGLRISESVSAYADLTIVRIAEVYLSLHANDGQDNPPPLYIHLYTKTSFPRRWNYLLNLLDEGKGLSQVQRTHDIEEHEPYEHPEQGFEYDTKGSDKLITGARISGEEDEEEQEVLTFDNEDDMSAAELQPSKVNSHSQKTDQNPHFSNPPSDQIRPQETHIALQKSLDNIGRTGEPIPVPSEHNNTQQQGSSVTDREDPIYTEDRRVHGRDSGTDASTLQGDNSTNPKRSAADEAISASSADTTVGGPERTAGAQEASGVEPEANLDNGDILGDLMYHEARHDKVFPYTKIVEDGDQGLGYHTDEQDTVQEQHAVSLDTDKEDGLLEASPGQFTHLSEHSDFADHGNADEPFDVTLGQHEDTLEVQSQGHYPEENGNDYQLDHNEVDPLNRDFDSGELPRIADETGSFSVTQLQDDRRTKEDCEEDALIEDLDTDPFEVDQKELQSGESLQIANKEFTYAKDNLYNESTAPDKTDLVNASSPGFLKRPRSDSGINDDEETDIQDAKRVRSAYV